MNVYENVTFGLRMRKFPKREIKKQVKKVSKMLGIEHLLARKPKTLSGGQRQALTLLMATWLEPALLLLDEHTAALDPKSADLVVRLTEEVIGRHNLTTLMVTHSMQQAVDLGAPIVMMHRGRAAHRFAMRDPAFDPERALWGRPAH